MKCKKCYHDCHCNEELHADEYGLCTCEKCMCGKGSKNGSKSAKTNRKIKNVVR